MVENIVSALQGWPKGLIILAISSLPVSELRGAIPVGVAMNVPYLKTYFLAVLGNLLPVIPLLILLNPVSARLRRFKLWDKFFQWLFTRTRRRADLVQKYEALGLAIFVAIPLPVTGAWTGCVAASLFGIKFKYALLSITVGVMVAGLVVISAVLGGKGLWHLFTS